MATFSDLRRLALALPETTEKITWGTDLTFRVREKMFAVGGEGGEHCTIKATPAEQAELIASDPETFAVAAYVGRFGWVRVRLAGVHADELRELLTDAWRATAPKRLVKAFSAGEGVEGGEHAG